MRRSTQRGDLKQRRGCKRPLTRPPEFRTNPLSAHCESSLGVAVGTSPLSPRGSFFVFPFCRVALQPVVRKRRPLSGVGGGNNSIGISVRMREEEPRGLADVS